MFGLFFHPPFSCLVACICLYRIYDLKAEIEFFDGIFATLFKSILKIYVK